MIGNTAKLLQSSWTDNDRFSADCSIVHLFLLQLLLSVPFYARSSIVMKYSPIFGEFLPSIFICPLSYLKVMFSYFGFKSKW